MADDEVDPDEHLREELDELHERLAALTGRITDLERDRDALYAEVDTLNSSIPSIGKFWRGSPCSAHVLFTPSTTLPVE